VKRVHTKASRRAVASQDSRPSPWVSDGRTLGRSVWRFLPAAPVLARLALAAGLDAVTPATGEPGEAAHRRERVAHAFHDMAVRLGGIMIKTGQALAARADLLPPETVRILARLEDHVPPRPLRVIRRELARAWGRPPGEVLATLDDPPLGAASLAQVHRGQLVDGRDVAVKVLYPGIEAAVQRDLALLPALLRLMVRPEWGVALDELVAELKAALPRELDLEQEARSAERIAAALAHRPDVVVPAVVREWSTRRVLVTEFVDGLRITDLAGLRAAGIDRQAVARTLVEACCDQVFRAGIFHADLHPGNLRVLPGPRLALLDFGQVKALSEPRRRALGRAARALVTGETQGAAAALHDLGFRTAAGGAASLLALGQLFFGTFAPGRGYADPARLLAADRRLREAVAADPLTRIPGDLAFVARVMGALSGIGHQLDSRIDLPGTILRYVAEADDAALPAAR
jgi:predicted unusual protein kinase regulating ubiquinone biosynthesis (AarF/ABC1/UbiB family)